MYDDDGFGAGTRGSLSYNDGSSFALDADYIVIQAQNDSWNPVCREGGPCRVGFGNTIQLANGTLITVYCRDSPNILPYLTPHNHTQNQILVAVVRWNLPPPPALKADDDGAGGAVAAAEPAQLLESYCIALDERALPVERFAAAELQLFMREMAVAGGSPVGAASLPIMGPAAAAAQNMTQLAVGQAAGLALGLSPADFSGLGDEGYRLCSLPHTGAALGPGTRCGSDAGPTGPHVVLAGGTAS
eukprot:SAG22_NODE_7055_length_781_cov_1.200880_1_plen_244_part_01